MTKATRLRPSEGGRFHPPVGPTQPWYFGGGFDEDLIAQVRAEPIARSIEVPSAYPLSWRERLNEMGFVVRGGKGEMLLTWTRSGLIIGISDRIVDMFGWEFICGWIEDHRDHDQFISGLLDQVEEWDKRAKQKPESEMTPEYIFERLQPIGAVHVHFYSDNVIRIGFWDGVGKLFIPKGNIEHRLEEFLSQVERYHEHFNNRPSFLHACANHFDGSWEHE